MHLTRRTLLIGGMSAVVAGCGTSAPPAPASTQPAGAFPRTVVHKYGTTEIPREPARVVTVGLSDQDYVLALGVVPVGVTDWYGEQPDATWPWARDALGDVRPEVMPRNEDQLDFERIAALAPDLIIAQYSGMTQADYETASQLAPVLAQSADFPDFGMPWQDTTRAIAAALGRPERGEELIAGIDARFATARDANPQFAGRAALVAERFDGVEIRSGSDPRTRFLTSLGFTLPDDVAALAGDSDTAKISDEQLALLDRDLLVWNAGFSPELRGLLADNPVYQQLTVVREGRVLFLEDEVASGALTWSSVLSLPYAIDTLVPQLAAALAGS